MEAKNFRIGNIMDRGRTIKEIKEDYYTDKDGMSTLFRDAKPMKLTESWLIKFGFTKYGDVIKSYKKHPNCGFKFEILPNDGKLIFVPHLGIAWDVELRYVHELQNLFFALTREELSLVADSSACC